MPAGDARPMWLLKFAIAAAAIYAAVVALAYVLQTWLIFPAGVVADGPPPAGIRYQPLETGDGERVVLSLVEQPQSDGATRPKLLAFGGNAWNADAAALLLADIFPQHQIAAMHYRGYGPSSGRPSARAILADAGLAHDALTESSAERVVAVGFSIGAAVAVDLAAHRPIEGLILTTPFASLKRLAASHYPWLPVGLFLRHEMEPARTLAGLDLPIAIIAAENDRVVPARHTEALRAAARDLRFDIVIDGAGHNDLYDRADFLRAMRQALAALSTGQ